MFFCAYLEGFCWFFRQDLKLVFLSVDDFMLIAIFHVLNTHDIFLIFCFVIRGNRIWYMFFLLMTRASFQRVLFAVRICITMVLSAVSPWSRAFAIRFSRSWTFTLSLIFVLFAIPDTFCILRVAINFKAWVNIVHFVFIICVMLPLIQLVLVRVSLIMNLNICTFYRVLFVAQRLHSSLFDTLVDFISL